MTRMNERLARWMGVVSVCLALLACGGGGGGGDAAPVQAKEPPLQDARNGSYKVIAADTYEYKLALDFDARTYHVAGAGVDQAGAITERDNTWFFQPGNATGVNGTSTTRFQVTTDGVVGELPLAGGATVPFIAGRKFVETVADAAGTYNMLGRTLDTTGAPADITIQQGEITADGHVRICNDSTIFDIPNCPIASLAVGTLTVSGDLFTAAFTTGSVPFRVAQVGADKLYLRSSVSAGATRRFVVGMPAASGFADDTFAGGTTEPAWGSMTFASTGYSSTVNWPSGATVTQTGTVAVVNRVPGFRHITTPSSGYFFAARSSEIGMVVAAQGNSSLPGFVAIGKKQ